MTQRAAFGPIDFKMRFPALDGIRAIAVLMVFLDHFGGGSHGGRLLRIFELVRQRGPVGVDLFFVLSGFLITGILYDTRNDSKFFRRFYLRRAVRIFPVFYLVVFVAAILTPIVGYHWRPLQAFFLIHMGNLAALKDFSLYDVPADNSTFRLGIGHFWTLCVEEQFYLLWPFVVWAVRDRVKLLWTAAALCVAVFLVRLGIVLHYPGGYEREAYIVRLLWTRADSMMIGGMLALLLRGPLADKVQRACFPVFLGGLVASLWIMSGPLWGSKIVLSIGFTVYAITAAALIGLTCRSGSRAFKFFYWKPLRVLGKYSYGFYIFHYLWGWAWIQFLVVMMRVTHSMVLGGLIALSSNFALTFLASKLSYDLYEVKFLRLKRYFEYDSEVAEHKHAFLTK